MRDLEPVLIALTILGWPAAARAHTLTANLGAYAPGGFASVAGRLEIGPVFLEGVGGYGITGPEGGAGLGLAFYEEQASTPGLGTVGARAYALAEYTLARTREDPPGTLSVLPDVA